MWLYRVGDMPYLPPDTGLGYTTSIPGTGLGITTSTPQPPGGVPASPGYSPGRGLGDLNPNAPPLAMTTERMVTNLAIGAAAGALLLGIGKFVFKLKFL